MNTDIESTGVETGMCGAIVNLCIQLTLMFIPVMNILACLNAFPTIALTFSIISASTSHKANLRTMSLRFASRAKTMNVVGTVVNIASFVVGFFALAMMAG